MINSKTILTLIYMHISKKRVSKEVFLKTWNIRREKTNNKNKYYKYKK